jgi:hypothetical protein
MRFIRVEMPVPNGMSRTAFGQYAGAKPVSSIFHILPGGWLLSSPEDRRFECRTIPILRLPDA